MSQMTTSGPATPRPRRAHSRSALRRRLFQRAPQVTVLPVPSGQLFAESPDELVHHRLTSSISLSVRLAKSRVLAPPGAPARHLDDRPLSHFRERGSS
jgi:hypothetical protein